MSAAENKTFVQRVYAELSRGVAGSFIENLADNIHWTVIGTTTLSGTITGRKTIIDRLFNRVETQLGGPTIATIKNIIAEGYYVVVESSGEVTTKTGKPYNNTYCEIYRFSNGKIHEVTVYLDTALVEAVFG